MTDSRQGHFDKSPALPELGRLQKMIVYVDVVPRPRDSKAEKLLILQSFDDTIHKEEQACEHQAGISGMSQASLYVLVGGLTYKI